MCTQHLHCAKFIGDELAAEEGQLYKLIIQTVLALLTGTSIKLYLLHVHSVFICEMLGIVRNGPEVALDSGPKSPNS